VKRTSILAVALALVVAATACGGGSSADESHGLQKVTVVLDWTPNTNHSGVYLARANGWYRAAGLDVKIVQPGDAGALQLLGSGKADVAYSPQEELIPARAQGVPVVAIAAVIQHNTSSLLALSKSGIEGPADLAGHTYGGFGGPLEKALVSKLVTCAGGNPKDVHFAQVGDVDYRVGLESGQFDFVWIFDGWDKIRLEQQKVSVSTIPFIDHTDCIPDWYTPMMATTEKELQTRRPALKKFMEVTRRGYQAAMRDPDAAADALIHAVPEVDPKLVRASARYLATRYASDPAQWGRQQKVVWTRFAAFLQHAGMIDGTFDVDPAFTNDLL
jgi:ABC-type nitrate/sulfonate/bicarbonate transport system substrate-binding protein